MEQCDKCKPYLSLETKYKPEEFLAGRKNSQIWIIGLNPKKMGEEQYKLDILRDSANLESYFNNPGIHPYFNDFKKVSPILYSMLGKNGGVASTDIVKCFSETFPPQNAKGTQVKKILLNCQPYLKHQISKMKPKLIICNGADVCNVIKQIVIPVQDRKTSYIGAFGDSTISVVLSGFIGRIDDYSKRRLGMEIESYMKVLQLFN